jgi:hypothetical protein
MEDSSARLATMLLRFMSPVVKDLYSCYKSLYEEYVDYNVVGLED